MNSEPLVVLGMHRSGTSFLIRALNLSGLWLGADPELSTVEGRASIGNPKGNYENREAIAINDTILKRSGGSWALPPHPLKVEQTDLARIRALCSALELGRPPEYPRWGWKDPRTLLTLDVWLHALQRPVMVLASFRHPTAVARSLATRDKIPLAHGYALWVHYNSILLRALDHLPHMLIRFDVDPSVLVSEVTALCEKTGLRVEPERIASWHDPELVRSLADDSVFDEYPAVAPIWRALMERHEARRAPVTPTRP